MITPAILRHQRGTTLIIALVFLVILTMFAISGVNTGIVNLRTANNQQMMVEAESAAQQQIEQVMNSVAPFETVASLATTTNVDANGDGYNDFSVVTQPPKCLGLVPEFGKASTEIVAAGSVAQLMLWEVVSAATDSVFGTSVTVRQGVKIRMKLGSVCVN